MKALLARADSVRLKTDDIEFVRNTLLRTPSDKFLQMQLKAATAQKDLVRCRRLTVAIKEAQLKSQGDTFQVRCAPILKVSCICVCMCVCVYFCK